MKIQAKDLKVGQDVKFGNEWMKIEKLIPGTQKNGKGFVNVCGMVYKGTIKATYCCRKRIIKPYYSNHNCPKLETFVNVR